MSDKINQYLERIGIRDYSERKSISETGNRKEFVDKIIAHPDAGKQFDRKSYKVEEDMKKAGIFYNLKG